MIPALVALHRRAPRTTLTPSEERAGTASKWAIRRTTSSKRKREQEEKDQGRTKVLYMWEERTLTKGVPEEGTARGEAVSAGTPNVAGFGIRQPVCLVHTPKIILCKRTTLTSCLVEGKIDAVT